MRVNVTFDIPEHTREAIRRYHGEDGKATREEIVRFIESHVNGILETIEFDQGMN